MWGLKNTDIEQLNDIFQKRTEIEEAIIFGSRAIGRHKPGSDVDIALKGSRLTTGILSALSELLNEETNMPYRFNLFLYSEIHSPDLLDHIDRVGARLYGKERMLLANGHSGSLFRKATKCRERWKVGFSSHITANRRGISS